MGWVGRLFDRRDAWARLLLLDLSGLSYLLFGADEGRHPTTVQWVLAVLAFVAAVGLSRWVLADFLTQTVLLAVAYRLLHDTTINEVGSSFLLAELVVWARRPRTFWLATGLLLAVHIALDVAVTPTPLKNALFGLILPIGLPLLIGLVIRTTRELGRQAEQQALAEHRRQELEGRAARADERSAIARELHDVVAHHVASMVLRVGVARHVLPGLDPRVAEVLDDVHGTGTAVLADLRRLVAVLRDPGEPGDASLTAIEPGALPAALGAAVETARRTGLTVEADIDEAAGALDAVRGMAVLRLTQEALTNVAKHAGPTARARLRVAVADGNVIWEVSDDGGGRPGSAPPGGEAQPVQGRSGAGVPVPPGGGVRPVQGRSGAGVPVPPGGGVRPVRGRSGAGVPVPPGGGHGLTGMRERVELLGGVLTAGPSGGGWVVRTELPSALGQVTA